MCPLMPAAHERLQLRGSHGGPTWSTGLGTRPASMRTTCRALRPHRHGGRWERDRPVPDLSGGGATRGLREGARMVVLLLAATVLGMAAEQNATPCGNNRSE